MSIHAWITAWILLAIFFVWMILMFIFPPKIGSTLEAKQAKCIDIAVFDDKFEQIEKCLLITKDQEAKP